MRQLPPIESCAECGMTRAGTCPFHETRLAAGSVLVAQGEKPERVWLIRRGTVIVTSVSGTGEETQCSLRGPGSVIGLEAVRDEASSYQAWTLSDATLCGLAAERFRSWTGPRNNPIGVVLDYALDELAERGEERIALAGRTIERVARFLVARRRMEKRDRPLRVQHQLLARMLGMRAETLSRCLRQLVDAGVIESGRHVAVKDPDRLGQVARGGE
jgi:CRP/FNR family cyclic AMP-dependent transcriptional regulator